jgi:hypothetical protein
MAKKKPRFCLTLKLNTEPYQEDILAKRFEISRKIYNALVTVTQKRYKEMVKTKKYRSLIQEFRSLYGTECKAKQKLLRNVKEELNALRLEYRITEYDFHADVKAMQHTFKKNIDSFTAQKIATRLWAAYDKLIFGDGREIRYKRVDTLNSLEGKTNGTGIRLKESNLEWLGLSIPIHINEKNDYELEALTYPIAFNRIIRKFIKGKWKYYIQIVFKGLPPMKVDKETGESKRPLGKGDVGLDIGTQTLAICSKQGVALIELADRVQNIENEKRCLLRYMDRSKRATNPNKFGADGIFKKGNQDKWVFSTRYLKARMKLRAAYTKQANVRKLQHEQLANEIIAQGDRILVEMMNFKGLQKRSKKAEKNDKGRFKPKKRFGKSLANKAPAMLLEIINRKLAYHDKELIKINTWKVKASQYNHFDEECQKKKLGKRWNYHEGLKIQRDLYSAFIIMNVEDDLESINNDNCKLRFNQFMHWHDIEINRLRTTRTLSSMGI